MNLQKVVLEDFTGKEVEWFSSVKEFNLARELNYEKYQELYDYYIVDFNGVKYELTPNQLKGDETTGNKMLDLEIENSKSILD